MGEISKHLPSQTKTVEAIYAYHKKIGDAGPQRGYLGASIIGHPCERYLWYTFRNCCHPEFDGRMYRLFETGDLAEERFVFELREIGCTVHVIDPDTCEQFAVSAFGGHFSGHLDGCALGIPEAPKTWHVLEFKTHKAKSYRELIRKGVKDAKPKHYAQIMVYMHLTRMKRALYLAVNKDTDELYSERVRYNKDEAEALMERAKRIILLALPPEGISDNPDYYQCRWCDAKDICFGAEDPQPVLPVPELSCRQCCHATPSLDGCDGRWICEKHKRALSIEDQVRTCGDHLILPDLLTSFWPAEHEQDDQWNDYICFENAGLESFRHGKGEGAYSSKELMTLSASVLCNDTIKTAKEKFGATATGCTEDILDRYPESECCIVWKGRMASLVEAWRDYYNEHLPDLPVIASTTLPTHSAAEYDGKRVAIVYPLTKEAEIRDCRAGPPSLSN